MLWYTALQSTIDVFGTLSADIGSASYVVLQTSWSEVSAASEVSMDSSVPLKGPADEEPGVSGGLGKASHAEVKGVEGSKETVTATLKTVYSQVVLPAPVLYKTHTKHGEGRCI